MSALRRDRMSARWVSVSEPHTGAHVDACHEVARQLVATASAREYYHLAGSAAVGGAELARGDRGQAVLGIRAAAITKHTQMSGVWKSERVKSSS